MSESEKKPGEDLSLGERLRRWEERMEKREDPSPASTAPPIILDRGRLSQTLAGPLEQEEATKFNIAALDHVNGDETRLGYLAAITTGFGVLKDPEDPMNLAKSCSMVHTNLKIFSGKNESEIGGILGRLLSKPENVATLINFLHWLWLVDEVPWLAKELSDDERDTLNNLKISIQDIFRHVPTLAEAYLMMGMSAGDHVLAGSAKRLSDDDPYVSVGRSVELTKMLLSIGDDELREWTGKEVLDVGSGLSLFPTYLRKSGVKAYSSDLFSADELLERIRNHLEKGGKLSKVRISEYLRLFQESDFNKWHRECSADKIPEIFGENRFHEIVACESFMHPRLNPIYRQNPMELWSYIEGALRGLIPEGGTLRIATTLMHFTPAMVEKVFMPLLLALRAGNFEIAGAYNQEGRLSFPLFFHNQFQALQEGKAPTLRIRRHPISEVQTSSKLMADINSKGMDEVIQGL